MLKTCWVYIMASTSQRLYTGVTSDLTRRVSEHKAAEDPRSFTARYKIDKLVYFETFDTPEGAIDREKQIKSYRREKKIALIDEHNPEWQDLYPQL